MAPDVGFLDCTAQGAELEDATKIDYFATGGRPFFLQFPAWVSQVAAAGHKTGHVEKHTEARQPVGELHSAFHQLEVKPWEAGKLEMLDKLQDAAQNRGQVLLMRDAAKDKLVAVKYMPNNWVRNSHKDFMDQYPHEAKRPWKDIGCSHFLSSVGFEFSCPLLGVDRDGMHPAVVTELASEGDLFTWCGENSNLDPGREREVLMKPLFRQIMLGVQELHNLSIVHGALSLENFAINYELQREGGVQRKVRVIDFGMSSTVRRFRACVSGKPSYQAPELHSASICDAFLTDAFALGVSLYGVLMKDYPWLSTRPGGCKCFQYYQKHGFRKYIAKRKVRGMKGVTIDKSMSEDLISLLEGLLAVDPAQRLTLGEMAWQKEDPNRRSVWDEPWLQSNP